MDELKIWPDWHYQNMERMQIDRPDLIQKLNDGDVDFLEIMEFINSMKKINS